MQDMQVKVTNSGRENYRINYSNLKLQCVALHAPHTPCWLTLMCQVMNHYAADTGDFGSLCLLVVPLYLHWQMTVKEIMAVTQAVYVKGSIYWNLRLRDWLCELQPLWVHVGMLISAFDILIGEGVHVKSKMGTSKNDRRWDDQCVCILCLSQKHFLYER